MLFKTKHLMHTLIRILNYFCFSQLRSVLVCQDLALYVHGQGDKVGSGRLHGEKELCIHEQYKYLFPCLYISALGTKYVQAKPKCPLPISVKKVLLTPTQHEYKICVCCFIPAKSEFEGFIVRSRMIQYCRRISSTFVVAAQFSVVALPDPFLDRVQGKNIFQVRRMPVAMLLL